MNQNWICKNIRNSDICLQKFGCFVWRIIFECNSLSFVNRNVRKSWKFRQITFCKNTMLQIHEFCKRSLEKAAYLVGILGQQSILKNHTRGHFLFHKIIDFCKNTRNFLPPLKSLEIFFLWKTRFFFKTTISGMQIHSVFEALQFFLSKWRFYAELCCDSLYAPTWNCIL